MKSRYFLLVLFFALLMTVSSFGQRILGGDITWTCINNGTNQGKYIFKLTLFNNCGYGSLSSSETLTVHNANISNISVSLQSEVKISESCYDTTKQLTCTTSAQGAITMGSYLSGPVSLSGVPPSSGFIFTWVHCCRNTTNSNLSGTLGYTLRSIMYPYKNANTSTCYDNSPQFLGGPIVAACVGYPFTFSHKGYDPDYDRVEYSWALPLTNSTTWPASGVIWEPGYNINNPFPGTFHNSNNSPASIRKISSEITTRIYSPSDMNIYHGIKARSLRDGIITAEVFRDGYMYLATCPPTPTIPPIANTPPSVTIRDSANSTVPYPKPFAIDTVFEGDTVSFFLESTDIGFLPGFQLQTNFLYATSTQFPTTFLYPQIGCDRPPCAKLDTSSAYDPGKNIFTGSAGVQSNFKWVTDSSHGSEFGTMYHFHFKVADNWCSQPGLEEFTYSILVYDIPDNQITGTVFVDSNANSIQDVTDPGYHRALLERLPNSYYETSGINGQYSFGAYQGTYDIVLSVPRYHKIISPSSGKHTVVSSGKGNTYSGKDFAIQAIPNIQDLAIDIGPSWTHRPGRTFHFSLDYFNHGTKKMNGSIEFTYSGPLSFDSASVTPTNVSGNAITWNYSGLMPFTQESMDLKFTIDTGANAGDSIFFSTVIEPANQDTVPVDNLDSVLYFVNASFDPNLKRLEPNREVYVEEIEGKKFLEYIVHFQNTGTDTAFTVRVEDELEENLDIETFEMLSASHSYDYEVKGRKIIWTFEDIQLPDSGTNFDASHGYLKFRIIADTNLTLGDTIYNSVDIFFDYNPPVVANLATPIIEKPIFIGDREFSVNSATITVFPNPTKSIVQLNIASEIDGDIEIMLYSLSGKLLNSIQGEVKGGSMNTSLDLDHYNSGVYFVQFTGTDFTTTKKLIKQ